MNDDTEYYTIAEDKLAQVVARLNKRDRHPVTTEAVRSFILADWPEGQEHQDWIDHADVDEIAQWIAVGLDEA